MSQNDIRSTTEELSDKKAATAILRARFRAETNLEPDWAGEGELWLCSSESAIRAVARTEVVDQITEQTIQDAVDAHADDDSEVPVYVHVAVLDREPREMLDASMVDDEIETSRVITDDPRITDEVFVSLDGERHHSILNLPQPLLGVCQ